MADETKPTSQPATSDGANISPAPTSVAEAPSTPSSGNTTPPAGTDRVNVEPLADGTLPTVIKPGESHRTVPKGKASISKIYRRADILTTLFTFAGLIVAGAVIVGAYYLLSNRSGLKTTPTPKVTTLDKSELEKLGSFFEGNAAGNAGQVLTISSSTLFKNRVATSSDLKVVGGAEISGPSILGDLTVNKTSTLGVVNVNGQLAVAGPTNLRGPALLGAGASINGNLSVTGTGSFGGAVSAATLNVRDVSVSGTLNLAGRLSISGANSTATPGSESGTGASANVEGNDAAGSVTINTGTIPGQITSVGGLLVRVNFRSAYPRTPKVIITPIGQNAAGLRYYVLKTATGFTIGSAGAMSSNTQYVFDYWVVQ
jgi:hypothetical protein